MAATAATAACFRVVCNGFSTQPRKNNVRTMKVSCVASRMDPFKTLSIDHGASESEVRKAFRKLALKYHPDVCKGNSCGIRFHEINEAYNTAIHNARTNIRFVEPEEEQDEEAYMYYEETPMDDEEELGNVREEWEAWTEVSYGSAAAGAF